MAGYMPARADFIEVGKLVFDVDEASLTPGLQITERGFSKH
jgi:hypothetical protein